MKRLVLLGLTLGVPLFCRAATTINANHHYSYGANIGWMEWLADSPTDGVVVGEFICSGWIYAANVGWINMGNGLPVDHIQYKNNSATDFGVNVIMYDPEYQSAYETVHNLPVDTPQPGYALLRGYAYGANIGWINFETTGNPRFSLFTGKLTGYAYSANCGWINLDDMAPMNPNYVQTDHIQMGADTNGGGNGIGDAWEWLYFGRFLNPGEQNSLSPNGNGMTLAQDYNDGVSPNAPNTALRVTAYSTNSGGTSSNLTFTTTTGRLYTIEVNGNINQPLNWTDSGLGQFAPDPASTTMRTVTQASALKKFFRVKTMRPLP